MIILGIDPGSRKAGYGLIEVKGRKLTYLASGVMRYDGVKEFLDRLGLIYQSCEELIENYKPDEVALEGLIYVKSPTSLIKLSQARGAMIAAFMKTHQRKVFEYSPNLVKSTVIGHGHASKGAIQKGLSMILNISNFKSDDESDALAIAICHALNRNQARVSSGRTLKDVFRDRL